MLNFHMLLRRIITSSYRPIRNYILWQFFRKAVSEVFKDYQNYKEKLKIVPYELINTCENSDLIPYINAKIAIQVLKTRGGSEISTFFFLYRFFSRLEKICDKLVKNIWVAIPPSLKTKLLTPLITKIWQTRHKYQKWFRIFEDYAFVVWSCYVWGSEVASLNSPKTVYFPVDTNKLEVFTDFLGEEGVNDGACGGSTLLIYEILTNPGFSVEAKMQHFERWVDVIKTSDGGYQKQGLILCLIALIAFFLIHNKNLAKRLLEELFSMVKSGRLSESLYKILLRRLKKNGHSIPSNLDM